ncbi:acyltransferase [uncultured Desulfobulbus sp.]|uniref:acyltransferase n=1 Tax=uncultured Desulfobulbus sp. TaxID=239745 RepID=UPI0029C6016B|nr:acyltransferase [uncultured Desulfobulbus sp.]
MSSFLLKIRRRETPFYNKLYLILKRIRAVNFPVIYPLHRFLYYEFRLRRNLWRGLWKFIYYEPLFKSQCESVGKGLHLVGGIPLIQGHLRIILGNNVSLHGRSTFTGSKVFESPTLRVGNNTVLGDQLQISVGCDVTIGDNVLIAGGVCIYSCDQHCLNPAERHLAPPPATSRPVIIEDSVWIGEKCTILKGVMIGRNSIVAAGTTVTKDVPHDSIVKGPQALVTPLIY